MSEKTNLLGFQIGKLLVIDAAPSINGITYWKCKCICGNIINKTAVSLKRTKHVKHHCGCGDKSLELSGKQFGYFTVVEKAEHQIRAAWKCKCVCGTEKIITTQNLTEGKLKSCGCKNPNRDISLINKKFGKLTVLSQVDSENKKTRKWNCLCECGNTVVIATSQLVAKNNNKTHCGCSGIKITNINLLNKRIGKLTVVAKTVSKRGKKAWECLCDCGNIDIHETSILQTNGIRSCLNCSGFKTEKYCMEIASAILNINFKKKRKYLTGHSFIEFDGYNKEKSIAIEYQGYQHYIYPNFWHKTEEDFKKQQERDELKRQYCIENDIKLIEVPYTEEKNLEKYIKEKLIELELIWPDIP